MDLSTLNKFDFQDIWIYMCEGLVYLNLLATFLGGILPTFIVLSLYYIFYQISKKKNYMLKFKWRNV